jgi:hypothetical protein
MFSASPDSSGYSRGFAGGPKMKQAPAPRLQNPFVVGAAVVTIA